MMLAPTKRRLVRDDGLADPNAGGINGPQDGGEGGSDAAPASPQPIPAPVLPKTGPRPVSKPTDTSPSIPDPAGGASAIAQLPDGAGGAISVPPVNVAPAMIAPTVSTSADAASASSNSPFAGMKAVLERAKAQALAAQQQQVPTPTSSGGGADGIKALVQRLKAQTTAAQASAPTSTSSAPTGGASDATPSLPTNPGTLPAGTTTPVTMPADTAPDPAVDPMSASTFDENSNMIGNTVLPTASPRLINLQGAQDTALQRITSGPDRLALAKKYIADSDSEYQRTLKDATNAAAEHGYLGSGRLTNQYGDAADRRTQQIDKLLTDASAGTIQDNLNNLNATSGVEGTAYGQEAGSRNELRTERGYEADTAQQAIQRRIQQAAAEAGMSQQDFENAMRVYALGQQGNPETAYENAAATAGAEAAGNTQNMTDLLRYIAARNNPSPVTTG